MMILMIALTWILSVMNWGYRFIQKLKDLTKGLRLCMSMEIPSSLHLEAREAISMIKICVAENMRTMCYRLQISEVDISTVTEMNCVVLNCGMSIRRHLSTLLCLYQTKQNLKKIRKKMKD